MVDEESFFGTGLIRDLPLEKLRCLTRTLKNRHYEWHRPVSGVAPAGGAGVPPVVTGAASRRNSDVEEPF